MSDYSKLSFTSKFRYEHIALKGHADFTVAAGTGSTTTVTITHDLGYKPYYKARYTYGSGKYFSLFAGTSSYDIDGNMGEVVSVSVTDTALIIVMSNFDISNPISGTIYYRIYAEPESQL